MKVGILGTGSIAKKMAETLSRVEGASCYAIGSRNAATAQEFAQRYQVEKAYGSYEQLVADPQVELVYIATPHSHHYETAKMSMEYGKGVLCEKAFMVNAKQAREIVQLAQEKKVFLAEAMWSRYLPSRKILTDLIAAGTIGEVSAVTAGFGGNIADVPRIYDPNLAGGALLDLGIYPLTFASMVLGDNFIKMTSTCTKLETGVDGQNVIVLEYPGGKIANLFSTALTNPVTDGIVYGSEGYLVAKHISNIREIEHYSSERKLVRTYTVPQQITGYEYEVEACMRAMANGELSCPEIPWEQSIHMMEVMDTLRKQWGIKYPME